MLDPRNPFMAALLKAQETRLVNETHLERLAPAGGGADLRAVLRDTDIGTWLEGVSWRDAEERDRALWRYLAQVIVSLEARRYFPRAARRFSRAYLLKYDVANLKAALQGLALGHRPRLLPIGAMHLHDRLEDLAAAQSPDEVAEVLTASGLRNFALALQSFNPSGGRKARLVVEAALEAEFYRQLVHTVRGLGGGFVLASGCGLMIDMTNLAILCRLLIAGAGTAGGESFIPGGHMADAHGLHDVLSHSLSELPRRIDNTYYGKVAADVVAAYERSGSVAVIDAIIEKHRLAALRELFAPQLAPAPVMAWFIIMKEIELRNVRLLISAVEDGIGLENVRRQVLM
jgi:vacuolar-type H+-ATPase subunit C/Vma6